MNTNRQLTPRQAEVLALHQAGKTCREIATALGVNRQRAWHIQKCLGLKMNETSKFSYLFPEVRSLHQAGKTAKQIAVGLGITYAQTRMIHDHLGLKTNRPKPKHQASVLALYQEGKADSAIAKKLNIDQSDVRRVRLRLDLPPNKFVRLPNARTVANYAKIQTLHHVGKSDAEMAMATGLCITSVQRIRKKYGLSCNRPNGVRLPNARTVANYAKIQTLHHVGKSDAEMAMATGLCIKSVQRIRKKYGLSCNRPNGVRARRGQ